MPPPRKYANVGEYKRANNELAKQWAKEHPERHREASKAWYHKNKDEVNRRRREKRRLAKARLAQQIPPAPPLPM